MINGRRLRELREAQGLSADDLAAILKMAKTQLLRYETGKSDATTDILVRFCNYFNVPADELLDFSRNEQERPILQWSFDLTKVLTVLPPERTAKLLKSTGLPIRLEKDTISITELLDSASPSVVATLLKELGLIPKLAEIDIKALMDEYPPAYVAKLIKELGIELKLNTSPSPNDEP